MPFQIRKTYRRNCFTLRKKTQRGKPKRGKQIFARCTSKAKAKRQLRLLNALTYNKDFVYNKPPQ